MHIALRFVSNRQKREWRNQKAKKLPHTVESLMNYEIQSTSKETGVFYIKLHAEIFTIHNEWRIWVFFW